MERQRLLRTARAFGQKRAQKTDIFVRFRQEIIGRTVISEEERQKSKIAFERVVRNVFLLRFLYLVRKKFEIWWLQLVWKRGIPAVCEYGYFWFGWKQTLLLGRTLDKNHEKGFI